MGVALLVAALVPSHAPAERRALADVRTFGYQLQGYDEAALQASPYDLLVIDTESDDGPWTAEQIAALRQGPCGPRIVLAYVSIGEAEDYRFYWDTLPRDLLAAENPKFRGNYAVRYWDPRWQRIVYGDLDGADESLIDRVVDAGFDGAYLDIIDAFEFWGPDEVGGTGERPTAAADMIALVEGIADHARRVRGRPDFLVFPQNGSTIVTAPAHAAEPDPALAAAAARARWFTVIDGIGAEDTFFFGRRKMNNPYRPQTTVIGLLEEYRAAGKTVLAIDYVSKRRKVERFYAECATRGWVPFVSNRGLSRIARHRRAPIPAPCE